jgi:hypothetical protein
MTWQHSATADEPLLTVRLYAFLASQPTTTEELRDQFARLAASRLADQEGTAQRNWTVRRRGDDRAVGMLQAAFSDQDAPLRLPGRWGVPSRSRALPPSPHRTSPGSS